MSALTNILTRELERITQRLKLYPATLSSDDVKIIVDQFAEFLEVYRAVAPTGAQADSPLEAQIKTFCRLYFGQRRLWETMRAGTAKAFEQLCEDSGTCPAPQEGVDLGKKSHDLKPKKKGGLSSRVGRMT